MKLYVDDKVVAKAPFRIQTGHRPEEKPCAQEYLL